MPARHKEFLRWRAAHDGTRRAGAAALPAASRRAVSAPAARCARRAVRVDASGAGPRDRGPAPRPSCALSAAPRDSLERRDDLLQIDRLVLVADLDLAAGDVVQVQRAE